MINLSSITNSSIFFGVKVGEGENQEGGEKEYFRASPHPLSMTFSSPARTGCGFILLVESGNLSLSGVIVKISFGEGLPDGNAISSEDYQIFEDWNMPREIIAKAKI